MSDKRCFAHCLPEGFPLTDPRNGNRGRFIKRFTVKSGGYSTFEVAHVIMEDAEEYYWELSILDSLYALKDLKHTLEQKAYMALTGNELKFLNKCVEEKLL